MNLAYCIFVLSNFIQSGIQAGIQSVGSGGGYGEMLAHHASANIQSIVKYCEWTKDCNLTAAEETLVHQASLLHGVEITFDSVCSHGLIAAAAGERKIRISSCALYSESIEQSPVVQSFSRISSLVLAGRLMLLGLTKDSALELATKAIPDFDSQDEAAQVDLDSGPVIFHLLRLSTSLSSVLLPSLEGKSSTLSLKDRIEVELQKNCVNSSLKEWQADGGSTQVLSANTGMVGIPVEWQCLDGQKWRGTAQIFFHSSDGEVTDQNVRLHLVQKQKQGAR